MPNEDGEDEESPDNTVSFKIPLDPNDPDGIKRTLKVKKLKDTTAENVLTHIQEFNELKETLEMQDGAPSFNLFETLLHNNVRRDWRTKKQENIPESEDEIEDSDHFEATLMNFVKLYIDD